LISKKGRNEAIWIRKWIYISKVLKGKSFLLDLGVILGNYKVYVNGTLKHKSDTREPSTIEVTNSIIYDENNLITICVFPATLGTLPGACLTKSVPKILIYEHQIEHEWRVEEGLYGQRENWFLPEYDDSDWKKTHIPSSWDNLGIKHKGVIWYRTRFHLEDNPKYVAPLRLTLTGVKSKCLIFLNGNLVGRYADIGPQKHFYLPEPWLRKKNVLALAIEDINGDGGISEKIVISPYHILEKKVIEIGF